MKRLLKYHPYRFFTQLKALAPKIRRVNERANVPFKYLNKMFDHTYEDIVRDQLITSGRDATQMHYYGVDGWCSYQRELYESFSSFSRHGSNIFHINSELVKMFENSKVDVQSVNNIKTPFKSFYFHFENEHLLIENKNGLKIIVDGAYVCFFPETLEFEVNFTSNQQNYDYSVSTNIIDYLCADSHFLDFYGNYSDVTIEKLQISIEASRYSKPKIKLDGRFLKIKENLLRILINSLLYISTYNDDIIYRFPNEAPKKLIDKLENSKSEKQRQRAESKISSLGFKKIYYCGDEIQRTTDETRRKNGKAVMHWRRGHWRNQACGEGFNEHKLIWIKPVLVNMKDSSELPAIKHIYDVNKSHKNTNEPNRS